MPNPDANLFESEKVTRKKRIDPRLSRLGWIVTPYQLGLDTSLLKNHAVEEYPTSNGPADYALFVDGRLIAILEAKKVAVATLNTLEQAKRYAKGLVHSIGTWNGYMVPFLYSSNGELISFLDVRNERNLARNLADFHTPAAVKELFNRNIEVALKRLEETPNDNPFMRPYQKLPVAAVENAVGEGKRKMLIAITGTGKTFMAVNCVYRRLKSGTGRDQIEQVSTSTSGLNTLSISKVSKLEIPLPSIEEQQEIVRRVEQLFTLADKIEARYNKAKAQFDKLPQSLLAKAFRGELVPQDENDEPASVLLERIKKEREKIGTKRKSKKNGDVELEELSVAEVNSANYKRAKK